MSRKIVGNYFLTKTEVALLNLLNHHQQRGIDVTSLTPSFVAKEMRINEGSVLESVSKLKNNKLVVDINRGASGLGESDPIPRHFYLTDLGLQYAYEYNHPDYWEGITVWFRSKWWSIPVFLLVVGAPLITAWKGIIEWIISLF